MAETLWASTSRRAQSGEIRRACCAYICACMCVEASCTQLEPQSLSVCACVRARASPVTPHTQNRHLWIGYRSYGTRLEGCRVPPHTHTQTHTHKHPAPGKCPACVCAFHGAHARSLHKKTIKQTNNNNNNKKQKQKTLLCGFMGLFGWVSK